MLINIPSSGCLLLLEPPLTAILQNDCNYSFGFQLQAIFTTRTLLTANARIARRCVEGMSSILVRVGRPVHGYKDKSLRHLVRIPAT